MSRFYVQTSNDELQHAWLKKGQAKEDHKYIKREWKNGRWVYYYDSDTSAKNSSKYNTTKIYYKDSKDLLGSRTTIRSVGDGNSKTVIYNRGKLERAAPAAKKKVYETRPDGGDSDGLLGGTRTFSIGNQVISRTTYRGKLERAITAGKEYVRYLLNED
jgi:hypothetical protein